jgi:hypothetical protein
VGTRCQFTETGLYDLSPSRPRSEISGDAVTRWRPPTLVVPFDFSEMALRCGQGMYRLNTVIINLST